ncbi:MAG: tRNA 2-thiouridine(34) synthase MnmA [bacterium]|nr:tRNA 2-thiouridine(34) synthase MnmA [bacterium]
MNKTVFVGMSGGVDSSVTAGLLKDQGYNVIGVHLKCWNVDGCAEADAEDARRAAETLGIPFYVFDFEKEYRERVVQYMVDGYRKGITPNPDVACNQEIKFGLFYKRALEMGADYVATGHYVQLKSLAASPHSLYKRENHSSFRKGGGRRPEDFVLYAARDASKDQSYFLWTLKQNQLAHCLFPLGDLIKRTQVRALAKKYKLPNAEKKDSQGICFIGQVSLPEFLSTFIPQRKGTVVNIAGEKVGEHQGAQYYTIGQRKGLGIGGSAVPLYVSKKDVKKNIITLAPEGDSSLYQSKVTLSDVNFISPQLQHSDILANVGMSVWCRMRYRQPLFKARIMKQEVRIKRGKKVIIHNSQFVLQFDRPVKFVAPGQSAVFYDKKGQMLGGGIIEKAYSS